MELAAILATNAGAVAVVGWLLQRLVDKRLSHALGQQLEHFKAELAKEVATHSIKQGHNYTKQIELFAGIYSHMVDLDFELKSLLMNIKTGNPETIDSRAQKFCDKYTELNACLQKGELFLPGKLVSKVRDSYSPFFELAIAAMVPGCDQSEVDAFRGSLPSTIEEINDIGDSPRRDIVRYFRELAGIDLPED